LTELSSGFTEAGTPETRGHRAAPGLSSGIYPQISIRVQLDAQPSLSETALWEEVNGVLLEARVVLQQLQEYRGAGDEIRQAIQSPSVQGVQEKAWSAVVPLVGKLKTFYVFSQKLEGSLRLLLGVLTSSGSSPTQQLEQKQALARQFAHILHFTLRFDELKMTNPAIQNDFSYYRRTISRMRINNLANPDLPIENTTDCLSTMASVCKVMLETPEYRTRFASEETVLFCLHERLHQGAEGSAAQQCGGLLNALRYTTKHLNDEATSKQIKTMLQPN
ncbi:hypothetical protein F7725_010925, partial [Dissostichus mawsoni]